MANRSYLYSFKEGLKGKLKFNDISEQNYAIPIIYKILVSENTQLVPSVLFTDHLALIGSSKNTRKKLENFFNLIEKESIFDEEEFKESKESFLKHLDEFTLDSFLFEPVEVISMDDININEEVELIFNEIQDYDRMIFNYINDKKEYKNNDMDDLGIDPSSFLYFTLNDNDK